MPAHNAASLLDASKCFTRLLLNSSTLGKDARLFTGQEGEKKKRGTGAPNVVVFTLNWQDILWRWGFDFMQVHRFVDVV